MNSDDKEDFYIRDFERRDPNNYGKRHNDNHQPPCLPLRVTASNVVDFKDCVKELKDSIKELSDEQREFRENMIERMSNLENTIVASKSFVSGVGWILGGIIALGVWIVDKFSGHIKL